jgi:hypothetical protein
MRKRYHQIRCLDLRRPGISLPQSRSVPAPIAVFARAPVPIAFVGA